MIRAMVDQEHYVGYAVLDQMMDLALEQWNARNIDQCLRQPAQPLRKP
jgi:hypothetical protein